MIPIYHLSVLLWFILRCVTFDYSQHKCVTNRNICSMKLFFTAAVPVLLKEGVSFSR